MLTSVNHSSSKMKNQASNDVVIQIENSEDELENVPIFMDSSPVIVIGIKAEILINNAFQNLLKSAFHPKDATTVSKVIPSHVTVELEKFKAKARLILCDDSNTFADNLEQMLKQKSLKKTDLYDDVGIILTWKEYLKKFKRSRFLFTEVNKSNLLKIAKHHEKNRDRKNFGNYYPKIWNACLYVVLIEAVHYFARVSVFSITSYSHNFIVDYLPNLLNRFQIFKLEIQDSKLQDSNQSEENLNGVSKDNLNTKVSLDEQNVSELKETHKKKEEDNNYAVDDIIFKNVLRKRRGLKNGEVKIAESKSKAGSQLLPNITQDMVAQTDVTCQKLKYGPLENDELVGMNLYHELDGSVKTFNISFSSQNRNKENIKPKIANLKIVPNPKHTRPLNNKLIILSTFLIYLMLYTIVFVILHCI